MWLKTESKHEFSKWKGCSKVGRVHMQAEAQFLLRLKGHLFALYVFFSTFSICDTHDLTDYLVEVLQKKKGLSGQVVSLWLLQEESVEKEDKISPDNPPCVSTTAWEKSSFSPRCLETLFLYVHGDTCYISGRQHEGYEAAKILTFWTTLEAIQGQMALHLKEKGDSCVFWFLHHNWFENDDQVKAILGT